MACAAALAAALIAPLASAASKKNPASKLFIAETVGGVEVITKDRIIDQTTKGVHSATGVVLQTKKPSGAKGESHYTSLVYSNGTGVVLGADTRMEIQKFDQEPFVPNRSDIDLEPSISDIQAILSHGTIGLCTSKLAAGSRMVYQTPHGNVNIRQSKVVIEANDEYTRIAMLEGDSTVRGGVGSAMEMGGQKLSAGQQAIIRRRPGSQTGAVQIESLSGNEMAQLGEKVGTACLAKKTVYFDTATGGPLSEDDPEPEIVAKEVVPVDLPVAHTISTARIGL